MFFITVSSQKFQFDRLLKMVDQLIEKEQIPSYKVYAQIGNSHYIPEQYDYKYFLTKEEIDKIYNISDVIITHAGTGSIINAIKRDKKVIVVPRDVKYGEHVDNHQYQIAEKFSQLNYCLMAKNYEELNESLHTVNNIKLKRFKSNTDFFLKEIKKVI